jgi:hypothetical protein
MDKYVAKEIPDSVKRKDRSAYGIKEWAEEELEENGLILVETFNGGLVSEKPSALFIKQQHLTQKIVIEEDD